MKDFRYIPEGISPQGRPRVYFTCHPGDREQYFDTIGKELLDRQNCTVFYLDGDTRADEVEDYEIRLGEMQLFVVPVTTKLLTKPCRAMDVDVPFALSHHIPVLPLMQESGLDELFTKKFGDLQYLDKTDADPTAISYDEKLTRYLNAVIVGDELAKQVRAAFDAYIFLSYRKKDRRYAQELMRLIHSNPMCRDIAIWYDEFLTPGENFNSAIRQALEKSDLFALAVTPNLINELNYILSTEYPMARELNKEILPAELLPTDREKLREMYEGIPEPVSTDDREKLTQRLLESVRELALLANDSDPQHNFFIGLAYLSGIDVEVDHERAVKLITSAAEADYIPAIEKLVSMYTTGEGVKRDKQMAIRWQEALMISLKEMYREKADPELAKVIVAQQYQLGERYIDIGMSEKAVEALTEQCSLSEAFCSDYGDETFIFHLFVGYTTLGQIAKSNKKLPDAEVFFTKAADTLDGITDQSSVMVRRCRAICLHESGNLALLLNDIQTAERSLNESLKILKSLVEESNDTMDLGYLAGCYCSLGDLADKRDDAPRAEALYAESITVMQRVSKETRLASDWQSIAIFCDRIADVAILQGRTERAAELYMTAFDIRMKMIDEHDTVDERRNLAISYGNLGLIEQRKGDLSEAAKYYREEITLCRRLVRLTDTAEEKRALSAALAHLGDIRLLKKEYDPAFALYHEALAINLALDSDTPENRHDIALDSIKLGIVQTKRMQYSSAKDYFESAFELFETIVLGDESLPILKSFERAIEELEEIAWLEGDSTAALTYCERALQITRIIFKKEKSVESLRRLIVGLDRISRTFYDAGDLIQSKKYAKACMRLIRRIPFDDYSARDRYSVGLCYLRLGDIKAAEKNGPEADWYYSRSREELEKTLEQNKDDDEVSNALAICFDRCGNAAVLNGRRDQAAAYYMEAMKIRERLMKKDPNQQYCDAVAISYYKLGTTLLSEPYLRAALEIWEELQKIFPFVKQYQEKTNTVKNILETYFGGSSN